MKTIAFCDDDISILQELQTLFNQYCADRAEEINCSMFHSPLELLHVMECKNRFDILFLDVLMPGENGIDAASEIRKLDNNVKIIFLTSSAEFAVQSYAVGAYFYQLKPICKEGFFRLMDSVLAACEKEQSDSIVLRCKSGVARIGLKELEYCEVIRRSLLLHKTDGTVLEAAGSMDSLCESLAEHRNFLRIHRSYLVNLEHIQTITPKTLIMSSRADATTTSRTRTLNTPSRKSRCF